MIRVERVTEKNWNSLVKLFEGSQECTDCWCMNHRSDPKSCPTGDSAKAALQEEIRSGKAYGLLALFNDIPAGWCAIDPVKTQIGHDYHLQTENSAISAAWMIHCLYVDPTHRGAGISKELIKSAIELSKSNGAEELLAFPIPEDSAGKFPKDIAEFSGRYSTFKKFNFEPKTRLDDFYQVVSKSL
jgi:GNAT superfamily N-acetyltransferase